MKASRLRWTSAAILAASALACTRKQAPYLGPAPPTITPAESRAVGCYRVLEPWVGVDADQFALLARHGRGVGPESTGRLIRPRGGHASAHWRAVAGDTLELVWTSAPSDSIRATRISCPDGTPR